MNMQFLMKQAQKIQTEITKAQKELSEKEYEQTSNGGAIVVKMQGNFQVKQIKIDPALMKEDVADLEVMLMSAINQTIENIEKERDEVLTPITGGAKFPGAF